MRDGSQEEEMEYRRYLRYLARKRARRRKVYIARGVVATVTLLVCVCLFFLIRGGIQAIGGAIGEKEVVATQTPSPTPLDVYVPKGYETQYASLMKMRKQYPRIDSVLLNLSQYPTDVLNLLISNEETMEFVIGYPKHKTDEKVSQGVTETELENGIPLFQQWDQRWGYLSYGNNIIAIAGCGPTCLSMVCSGLLQDVDKNPSAIAEFSIENNYYDSELGTQWNLMSKGAEELGLKVYSPGISSSIIKKQLKKGRPIICSMKPGDFTKEGHFIVLKGLTQEGKLIVNDPNSIARSEKEWDVETVSSQIKALWSYDLP